MTEQVIRVDNILWYIKTYAGGSRQVQPLCPVHKLRIYPSGQWIEYSQSLRCEDCNKEYLIPRDYPDEETYVKDRLDAKVFKSMQVLNLDDEAIPLAQDRVETKDGKFFVVANLNESKTGKRLVLYAGEKGKSNKTQIFVEPEIKRLSFDHKDLHPTDVFAKVEATFSDGTIAGLKKRGEN